jgi:hypothetical protein
MSSGGGQDSTMMIIMMLVVVGGLCMSLVIGAGVAYLYWSSDSNTAATAATAAATTATTNTTTTAPSNPDSTNPDTADEDVPDERQQCTTCKEYGTDTNLTGGTSWMYGFKAGNGKSLTTSNTTLFTLEIVDSSKASELGYNSQMQLFYIKKDSVYARVELTDTTSQLIWGTKDPAALWRLQRTAASASTYYLINVAAEIKGNEKKALHIGSTSTRPSLKPIDAGDTQMRFSINRIQSSMKKGS